MANKYYAVRKGRKCGIFTSWEECKKQVNGFSAAEFKSFKTKEEAEVYFANRKEEVEKTKKETDIKEYNEEELDECYLDLDCASAYVDGSYEYGRYSGAALILHEGREIPLSKAYSDDQRKLRNVAGEIMGVLLAIRYCQKNNVKKLCIYHDYIGLSEWANGNWRANLPLTKRYMTLVNDARKNGLAISFVKVKAHTGVEYNEVADRLAKAALRRSENYADKYYYN